MEEKLVVIVKEINLLVSHESKYVFTSFCVENIQMATLPSLIYAHKVGKPSLCDDHLETSNAGFLGVLNEKGVHFQRYISVKIISFFSEIKNDPVSMVQSRTILPKNLVHL